MIAKEPEPLCSNVVTPVIFVALTLRVPLRALNETFSTLVIVVAASTSPTSSTFRVSESVVEASTIESFEPSVLMAPVMVSFFAVSAGVSAPVVSVLVCPPRNLMI